MASAVKKHCAGFRAQILSLGLAGVKSGSRSCCFGPAGSGRIVDPRRATVLTRGHDAGVAPSTLVAQ